MTTLICEERELEAAARTDDLGLWLDLADFARLTGYERKPEGFCRDSECIPVPVSLATRLEHRDQINLTAFAELTQRPLVGSKTLDVWLLESPAQERQRALVSLDAPDFDLPDLEGRKHRLSDYRGKKVLLASWASW